MARLAEQAAWRYTRLRDETEVTDMARAVKDLKQDIRSLSNEEKIELLRSLIAELDAFR